MFGCFSICPFYRNTLLEQLTRNTDIFKSRIKLTWETQYEELTDDDVIHCHSNIIMLALQNFRQLLGLVF